MQTYIITAPNGKKYKVTGETREGAVAALRKMLGDAPQNASPNIDPAMAAAFDPAVVGTGQTRATPPARDTWTDTAAEMASGPWESAKAFGASLASGGQNSPSLRAIAADPVLGELPGPMQAALGFGGDILGGGLSLVGAGLSGAAGFGTEFIPGLTPREEERFGGDILGMSQFAIPELAGGASVVGRAATAAPKAAPVSLQGAAEMAGPAEIGRLTKKAANGSGKAKAALGKEAAINLNDSAAASRVGVDLPVDVFSDNPNVRAAAGLTRSKVASEAEALWSRAVKQTRDRADELMASIGGTADIAALSDSVKASLNTTQGALKAQAKALYEDVDAALPQSATIAPDNTVKAINQTIEALGGVEGMTPAEKQLYGMVTNGQRITYGRILREKSLIGKALERQDSPYSSVDAATLKRLYGALADDQMAAVSAIGDPDLVGKLATANKLTAQRKALEDKIVGAFGKDAAGSIAAKLRAAISQGAKGDISGFSRAMEVVPADLRKQAAATAIAAVTRSARATEPGFGLSEFVKVWGGISANAPVKNAIGAQIGPEGMKMLGDLFVVAKRVTGADSYVLRTGKANQVMADAMSAPGPIGMVLQSTTGKKATRAAATAAGSIVGGPAGAVAAADLAVVLTEARPDMLLKAGKLFASDEFRRAAVEAAESGAVSPATLENLAKSKSYTEWAIGAGLAPQDWLSRAFPVAAQAANDPYEGLWQRYGE